MPIPVTIAEITVASAPVAPPVIANTPIATTIGTEAYTNDVASE